MAERATPGDFRYATGDAKIPWAAVGECVSRDDLSAVLRFLLRPGADEQSYQTRLEAVERALADLCAVATPATKLTLGEQVSLLEQEVTQRLRCSHSAFVCNATAAFEIAYKFAGLKPGDEVISPTNTFIATIAYPLLIGAKVVFADIDPRTVNMDPADVARKVTDRTKVIVPVHIGGYPVDMDPIMELANARGITVLEDAAHAFGARYRGRMVGAIGHFGAFSFHEVKNTTALGEGGILTTTVPEYGAQFSKARFVGLDLSKQIRNWLYDVVPIYGKGGPVAAGNHSATEIQAVALRSQLSRLEDIIAVRRRHTNYLNERFQGVPGLITPPSDSEEIQSTHHLYLLRVNPDELGADIQVFKQKLTDKGVTNIPHFAPLYRFILLRELGYDTDAIAATCPNTERVFDHEFTHLPLYPLSDEQVATLADLVIETAKEIRG